jgi:hypothetical protein
MFGSTSRWGKVGKFGVFGFSKVELILLETRNWLLILKLIFRLKYFDLVVKGVSRMHEVVSSILSSVVNKKKNVSKHK